MNSSLDIIGEIYELDTTRNLFVGDLTAVAHYCNVTLVEFPKNPYNEEEYSKVRYLSVGPKSFKIAPFGTTGGLILVINVFECLDASSLVEVLTLDTTPNHHGYIWFRKLWQINEMRSLSKEVK